MDFQDLIRKRYSVRAYLPDKVEDEKLNMILEAARLAPTAANRQAFRVIVIKNEGREDELARIYPREWFSQAPLVLAVCGVSDKSWVRKDGKNFSDIDGAIVMSHMILAAAEVGLGTCWIGAFDDGEARRILELSENMEVVAFTPLGYPADSPKEKVRKPLSELVSYE